jgi:fructose-1-phosphate kinase PfkB-like protein
LINKKSNTSTEIVEEAEPVGKNTEQNIYKTFLKILPNIEVVIISGTKASGFSENLYPSIVRKAKKQNKRVILDIKGKDLKNSLKYKPDIIKPNFSEFASTFLNKTLQENAENPDILESIKERMKEIHNKFKTNIILTRGKFGTLYIRNNEMLEILPENIIPINTIGSGDAFTAGFASAWNAGESLEKAISKGHECGKLNALSIKPGNIL